MQIVCSARVALSCPPHVIFQSVLFVLTYLFIMPSVSWQINLLLIGSTITHEESCWDCYSNLEGGYVTGLQARLSQYALLGLCSFLHKAAFTFTPHQVHWNPKTSLVYPGAMWGLSALITQPLHKVCLTCDTWQASNTDAYFAMTRHWIEEVSPGIHKIQGALFGFTQMNPAHNRARLGHALYKIAKRLGITHKVSIIFLSYSSLHIDTEGFDWMDHMW